MLSPHRHATAAPLAWACGRGGRIVPAGIGDRLEPAGFEQIASETDAPSVFRERSDGGQERPRSFAVALSRRVGDLAQPLERLGQALCDERRSEGFAGKVEGRRRRRHDVDRRFGEIDMAPRVDAGHQRLQPRYVGGDAGGLGDFALENPGAQRQRRAAARSSV